ncbi:glycosyltransferase 87 family protein [Streptomyces sp. NPDC002643]
MAWLDRSGWSARLRRLEDLTWLYWLTCAVFALLLSLVTTLTPHRIWGACAALGYGLAAWHTRRTARPRARARTVGGAPATHRPRTGRAALPVVGSVAAGAAVAGSVVLPLLLLMTLGAAQSEVHVVEDSATHLLSSGTPYTPHPHEVDDYNPYLPGMALFGLPRALFGDTPLSALSDARLWFTATFLISMYVAGRGATAGALPRPTDDPTEAHRTDTHRTETRRTHIDWTPAVLLLASFPAVALPLAVGGVDLPVIGLMCLGLALAGRGGSGTAAGLAMGAAAALKWTAWPLLPVGLTLLAATAGRRAAVRAGWVSVTMAAVTVLPAVFVAPHAFIEHVIRFPLGEAGVESPATSPLPGHLLAAYVPGGATLAKTALVLAAIGVAASLVTRPPRTVLAAADRLSIGLALAMCLMPATRFGYLAYPLVLALSFRAAPALTAGGNNKGKESLNSLPYSTYSARGALRQGPTVTAESPAEAHNLWTTEAPTGGNGYCDDPRERQALRERTDRRDHRRRRSHRPDAGR